MDFELLLGIGRFLLATTLLLLLTVPTAFIIIQMEMKIIAQLALRYGPNRIGPKGIFQSTIHGFKVLAKEDTIPDLADPPTFTLAPWMVYMAAAMSMLVIPFAPGAIAADFNIGIVYFFAVLGLSVVGLLVAGWASYNKYSLLGGLRSSAQMVSYEISMGMSLIPVLLLAGNVTLNEIVNQQAGMHLWNVLTLTMSFFIFMVAAFAETNRLPFDLPEAESELIAGYHTEYSAMKFSMFPISEYANMATSSAMMALLFFGGWDIPFTQTDNTIGVSFLKVLLSIGIFGLKTLFFIFVFIWIRWTLPRFRYDQLMSLGWKFMLPAALAYIVIVAAMLLAFDYAGLQRGLVYGLIMTAVNVVLVFIAFVILDRGRIISPAYGRASPQQLARLRAVAAARAPLSPQSGD
jgi:NADH-quinone oxidoreductase subunit H